MNRRKQKRFPWWTLPVIVLMLCLLAAAWVFADEQIKQYEQFSAMRGAVSGNTIHGPVYIDDIPLTGMTMEQARAAVGTQTQAQADAFEATITHEGQSWRIASDTVPMDWDTESLLQKAYMIGRAGSLEQRYQQIQNIQTPVQMYSTFTYDKSVIREKVNAIATELTTLPENASVVAFDVVNRGFAFSPEVYGQSVDGNQLYQAVIAQLDAGSYGSKVPVEVTPRSPLVTKAELEASYRRIASYTTKTTSDKNRNTNIDLAAQALNGKMILPGETISFNETTGQRTREKGYQEAGAIENGRTVQEVGGGVCQVSSTLFNALVRADCAIVSRKPHAWPSDYVPRGEDATVDWPSLDLVMRNTSDAPLFLTAWYEDQTVTVEVYGMSLGDGVSVELESETTYTKKPTEVVYTYNAKLPVGTKPQLSKKPRTGYSVQTYKIWYHDGVEVSREKFYTSEYRVINEEYEYNDGNPPT